MQARLAGIAATAMLAKPQRARKSPGIMPESSPESLVEAAPAKLNLALHLRRRRVDGFHDLETVFAFTDFGDTLSVVAGDGLTLTVDGDFAGPAGQGPDNLVMRAAAALAQAAGIAPAAALHLHKRIPVAAGLGGGSADAAAALRLLARFWGLDWPMARLVELAARLGADVPACVASCTCLGSGRGEVLRPWPVDLAGTAVLLVNPRVAVPTGPVFAGWDRQDRGGISGVDLATLRNDMTPVAIAIAPVIGDVLMALTQAGGAELVRMSGSGATCLATYRDVDARARAAAALAPFGWWMAETQLI
jgi:4-diphosphocytidyl-2-C-methyl-D-erythritol kinase